MKSLMAVSWESSALPISSRYWMAVSLVGAATKEQSPFSQRHRKKQWHRPSFSLQLTKVLSNVRLRTPPVTRLADDGSSSVNEHPQSGSKFPPGSNAISRDAVSGSSCGLWLNSLVYASETSSRARAYRQYAQRGRRRCRPGRRRSAIARWLRGRYRNTWES